MAMSRPVTQFEYVAATAIIAGTIVMASSFSYFFVGPIPIWILFGVGGFLFACLNSRLAPAWFLAKELRWVGLYWLLLIIMSGTFDVLGSMPRDLFGGVFLNFSCLIVFTGLFVLATYANNRVIIAVIILVGGFQGLIGVAQFFGLDMAWRFPDILAGAFPNAVRIEYDSAYDISMMSFQQIGRVRGSLPYVHVYNQVQALLVAISIVVVLSGNALRFASNGRALVARAATLMAIIGVCLSFSRSGILAIICATLIALKLNPKASKILIILSGSIIIITSLVLLGFSESDQFYRFTQGLDDSGSNLARYNQYEHAWTNFLRNPLLGSSGPSGIPDMDLPIHSVPVRYLNDYGLVGLSLYAIVFFGLLIFFMRRLKSQYLVVTLWASCGLSVLFVVVVDSWTHSSGFLRRDLLQTALLGFFAGAMLAAEWRARLPKLPLEYGGSPRSASPWI